MLDKSTRGVTLVALVLTIIVMLILVSVSVNIVIDSDLIGATEDTVAKWNEAADKEKEDIDKLLGELGNITQDQCNHQYEEWEIIKEATCTEEGSKTAICTECNYKTTEIIEATAHTYETGVCTKCGHELAIPEGDEAIAFGDVIWSTGIAGITVSTETEYKIQYQINNIDGQWVEVANNTMITGLANGDTVYARLWNGKTGGDYTSADIICTHNYENGTCTICGVTCEHTYGSWTTVKEATCTETGTKQRVCSTCNNRDTQTIEATSHTYEIGVCTKCGHELAIPEGDEAISFGNVEWNSGVAKITVSTGTEYKIQYQINSISESGWKEIENNGTITDLENGDTVYARLWNGKTGGDYASADIICTHSYENGTCIICGITCEHDFGTWTIVKEATCEETGAQQRMCNICSFRETQTIEATSHYYSEATCTTLATCIKCNATTGELVPHNYSEATCTKLATCSECGATTGELLAHQYSGGTCIVCGAGLPEINAGVVATENSIYKKTEDGKEKTVVIPTGFAVSGITDEQSIKDGLVIYNLPLSADTSSATFWTADSDGDTYPDVQENYNQFVWVPVEEAYVTAAEITSIISVNSFTDEEGLTARQKAINYLVSQGRYPMAVQLDNGKNYRGILYSFAAGTNGGVAVTALSDFNILAEESYDWNVTGFKEYYREPGTVSYDYGLDATGAALETNPNAIELTQAKLQAEYDSMVKSVNENGGFYVARYELIQEGTTGALAFGSKRGQTVASAAAESGNTWYGLYDICWKLYNNDSLPVQSAMISGSQWDQIMIWMKDVTNTYTNSEGSTVNTYYVIDSTNMGNYNADTGGTGAIQVSGYQNNYSVKKIFDLGGNLSDWTSEARDYVMTVCDDSTNYSNRVLRGNYYNGSASSDPASSRYGYNNPANTDTDVTARSTLYIK